MVNPWFKFYGGEYLSDTKMMALDAVERGCWITILSLANQSEGGVIKYISEEKILELSNVPIKDRKKYQGLLQKLLNLKMLLLDNGDVTVKNWEKRQYSEGYSRVKRYRDNVRVTEDITTEKKRIEENRREYNKGKEKIKEPESLKKMREQFGKKHSI